MAISTVSFEKFYRRFSEKCMLHENVLCNRDAEGFVHNYMHVCVSFCLRDIQRSIHPAINDNEQFFCPEKKKISLL